MRAAATVAIQCGRTRTIALKPEGAAAVAGLLPDSALLSVHGWAIRRCCSRCADIAASRYLVELALPAHGTICQQDRVPFSTP